LQSSTSMVLIQSTTSLLRPIHITRALFLWGLSRFFKVDFLYQLQLHYTAFGTTPIHLSNFSDIPNRQITQVFIYSEISYCCRHVESAELKWHMPIPSSMLVVLLMLGHVTVHIKTWWHLHCRGCLLWKLLLQEIGYHFHVKSSAQAQVAETDSAHVTGYPLGLGRLCRHNFEHDGSLINVSIIEHKWLCLGA